MGGFGYLFKCLSLLIILSFSIFPCNLFKFEITSPIYLIAARSSVFPVYLLESFCDQVINNYEFTDM